MLYPVRPRSSERCSGDQPLDHRDGDGRRGSGDVGSGRGGLQRALGLKGHDLERLESLDNSLEMEARGRKQGSVSIVGSIHWNPS